MLRLRVAWSVFLCAAACVAVFGLAGCSGGGTASSSSASKEATPAVGANMAGPEQNVVIPKGVFDARPAPWDLSTPQSAVRSYLDWVTYSYRTAESDASTPTMGPDEAVRIDSYIQYNLQKSRLVDQTLLSLTFATPSTSATHTTVPAVEKWSYSYRSIKQGNAILGGPYSIGYDSYYTVAKNKAGQWVVMSVQAQPSGKVK